MNQFAKIKRNLLRNTIGIFSFSTALFVFQACYGTPQDFGQDIFIEGKIISQDTDSPIKGIQVSIADNTQTCTSDINGYFSFYTANTENYRLTFTDVDPQTDGSFASADTNFVVPKERIFLNIKLQDK